MSRRTIEFRCRPGWLALRLCVFAVAFFGLSQSALAGGSYKINVCADTGWLGWAKVQDGISNDWLLAGNCTNQGSTYAIDFRAESISEAVDQEVSWIYPDRRGTVRSGLTIGGVDVILSGSDGSDAGARQGLRFCGHDCGELVTVSQPNLPDGEHQRHILTAGDAELPAGATELRFVSQCLTLPCGPTRPLKILKLELTLKDSVAPVSRAETISINYEPSQSPIDFGWKSQPFQFRWHAEDSDSGVNDVSIVRSGAPTPVAVPNSAYNCYGYAIAALCPLLRLGHQWVYPADAIWLEGRNKVYVDARDRAGNASPRSSVPDLSFYVDRRNPTPTGLKVVEATAAGWVADPEITLKWTNTGENQENKSESDPHSGVVAAEYDFKPLAGQSDPAPARVDKVEIEELNVPVPAPGAWDVTMNTIDAVGNRSAPMTVSVGFDDAVSPAPEIDPIGWVGSAHLLGGHSFTWIKPQPTVSGICGYGLSVDDAAGTPAPGATTIPGDVQSGLIPSENVEGARHLHLRAISCAGVAGETADRKFEVDLTPPKPTVNLADGAWVGQSRALRVVATDDRSGVEKVQLEVDGATMVFPGAEAAPNLPEGRRIIQYSASDAAGNISPLEQLTVGVDHSAPLGWFEPPSEERPTLISATVTDAHSGIGSGSIEYRFARSGADWADLPTRIDPVAGGDSAARLTARFPDFSLPGGTYDLRVRAIDKMGNASEITNRFDGLMATISTPVRERTRITFAFEHRRKSRCSSTAARGCKPKLTVKSKLVTFGQGAKTEGLLVDATGKPLAGRTVTLFAQRTGSKSRTTLQSLATDSRGRFRARVKPGVNRRIVARFDGGELLQPSEGAVEMFTRSKLSLRVSSRRVRSGGRLVFSGRLSSGGEKIVLGRPIYIRALGTRLAAEATVGADGRFRGEFPSRIRPPALLTLQAHIPQQDGWPYYAGDSRVVKVTIVP